MDVGLAAFQLSLRPSRPNPYIVKLISVEAELISIASSFSARLSLYSIPLKVCFYFVFLSNFRQRLAVFSLPDDFPLGYGTLKQSADENISAQSKEHLTRGWRQII